MLALLQFALQGALAGWFTHLVMPDTRCGRLWAALLVGVNGALIGQVIAQHWLSAAGSGIGLFMTVVIAFLFLAFYRWALGRLLIASPDGTCAA